MIGAIDPRWVDLLWIAAAILTLTALVKSPIGSWLRHVLRWLWTRNVAQPVGAWATEQVRVAVKPMFDTLRQSSGFERRQVDGRIDEAQRRLDRHDVHILDLEGRYDHLDERVTELEAMMRGEA
jgi:hypothetical protein